eukprot:scaffold1307_cov106-Isochrysis_galbana.AAC.5
MRPSAEPPSAELIFLRSPFVPSPVDAVRSRAHGPCAAAAECPGWLRPSHFEARRELATQMAHVRRCADLRVYCPVSTAQTHSHAGSRPAHARQHAPIKVASCRCRYAR